MFTPCQTKRPAMRRAFFCAFETLAPEGLRPYGANNSVEHNVPFLNQIDPNESVNRLSKKVGGLLEEAEDALLNGKVSDWGGYQRLLGRYQALSSVKDLLTKQEEDDDRED